MVETEIKEIPPLTPAEQSLLNCHSLLNLYNVVRGELCTLGCHLADDPLLLETSLAHCDERVRRLSDPGASLADAARDHELEHSINSEVERQLRQHPRRAAASAVMSTRASLDSLLWILRVRTREVLARASAPWHWAHFSLHELEADFQEWLRGLEQTSRGRYRFVQNLALQDGNAYYLDLRFASARGSGITMPAVLKDVLRDLIANARKYTAPGGEIRAALHAGPDGVRLVVEDTGRGIPRDEITRVVHFGERGSNVADVRTLGHGCGLTKAFVVTQKLGGRFWIASEQGRGTRVRLWIPPQTSGPEPLRALD